MTTMSDLFGHGARPTGEPVPDDPWTSPLWGRPDTVAGGWPQAPTETGPIPVPPPVAPTRRWSRGLIAGSVAAVLVAVLALAGIANVLLHRTSATVTATQQPIVNAPVVPSPLPSSPTLPSPQGIPSTAPNQQQGSSSGDVTAAVAPALVDINTVLGYDGGQGAGTGIVLTSDGVVLTNHHVIAGATKITATDIGNGRTYAATVLGYDRTHDIAVIKLTGASGLTTAPLGDSSQVQVGDSVVALGNAGGVGGQPTAAPGTVTALNQSIVAQDAAGGGSEQLEGLIQVDANVQPGDSGGALINDSGKVIGVVTAGAVAANGDTGNQGDAVPINQARSVAQQIIDGRASSTVHIGATAFLGVQVSSSLTAGNGVLVAGVISGTAAAQAGIEAGDQIVAVDGQQVSSQSELSGLLSAHHPGDSVTVQWVDVTGATHSSTVRLGTGPVG